ncbi:MAG: diaminopimelate epimerase [Sporichthyaceae bacterium]
MSERGIPFLKGHGTENDFVLLPDVEGRLKLEAADVAAICDRRAGIGADGILRVVRTADEPDAAEWAGQAGEPASHPQAEWFMDYRNADGSIAEMCGNGIRVFARYLVDYGLAAPGRFPIATRGGVRIVECGTDGPVTVDMGAAVLPDLGPVTVRVGDRSWPASAVYMPNPHAVVVVEDVADAGDLLAAPVVEPSTAYPEGVNVEFIRVLDPAHLQLRVHERGSGETRSCGTGVCAAVVAAQLSGHLGPGVVDVDVPGGRLQIEVLADGTVLMTGPAVFVASGEWYASECDERGTSEEPER